MVPAEEKNITGDKLIAMALAAYGIGKQYVLGSCYDELAKEAIIVTNGGSKVRYTEGQVVEKLREIAVTGINPVKRKVIAGKEKK